MIYKLSGAFGAWSAKKVAVVAAVAVASTAAVTAGVLTFRQDTPASRETGVYYVEHVPRTFTSATAPPPARYES